MPRGPSPTPTELLAPDSKIRKKREREPKPRKKRPPCPRWLNADERKVWKAVVPILVELNVITEIDGQVLARYCTNYVQWKRCRQHLEKYGYNYPTKDKAGNVTSFQQFPEVAIMARADARLLKVEQEFGLTPAARARIVVDVVEDLPTSDDLIRLMTGEDIEEAG